MLGYSRPDSSRVILKGLNEYRDSVYIVLDRKNKTYPLYTNHSF